MKSVILNHTNSVLNNFLYSIRDHKIQLNRSQFRANLSRCGEIMAYEISKELNYRELEVTTPLATTKVAVLDEKIVLGCVLRASLPFYQGFLNYFDEAESGFIGIGRVHSSGNEVEVEDGYYGFPDINNKTLMLVDPMLATGKSLVRSIDSLLTHMKPKKIIIASLIATKPGWDYVKKNMEVNSSLYTAAMDEKLDERFYIVPGLGDAGDLAFGLKKEI